MTVQHATFLLGAALVAGAINSVAGGGSFLSFPALVFLGVPPVNANATNTLALWPANLATTAAYREAMAGQGRVMWPLLGTATIGGVAGAWLLLHTPQLTFLRLIPWLMLLATLLLAFSRQLTRLVGDQALHLSGPSRRGIAVAAGVQLIIAVYIGYFGAGCGMMMLAMFALMGVRSIHTMNGLKALLATIGNGVAVVAFIAAKAIFWPQALLMTTGAMVGGYGGAWYAQKLNPTYVRALVILIGTAMTIYFFVKTA